MRALALASLLLAPSALAADAEDLIPARFRTLKLGLWETTLQRQGGGPSPLEAMAAQRLQRLPPEKRAQVEAFLKQQAEARGGAQARAAAEGGPRTHQHCLTREKLERRGQPFVEAAEQAGARCTHQVLARTATSIHLRSTCERERGTIELDARYEMTSREAVAGTVTVESQLDGQPLRFTSELSSRWVAASCGEVK